MTKIYTSRYLRYVCNCNAHQSLIMCTLPCSMQLFVQKKNMQYSFCSSVTMKTVINLLCIFGFFSEEFSQYFF